MDVNRKGCSNACSQKPSRVQETMPKMRGTPTTSMMRLKNSKHLVGPFVDLYSTVLNSLPTVDEICDFRNNQYYMENDNYITLMLDATMYRSVY